MASAQSSSSSAWNVEAKLRQLAERADEEDRRTRRRRKLLGFFLVVALLCIVLFTLSFSSVFSPFDSVTSAQSPRGAFSSIRPSYLFSQPFVSSGAASTRHTLPDNSEILISCARNTTRANAATYTKSDPNFPRPVPWVPWPGKYLLATCVRGRLTNRHECLHKSLLVAMLLNRTLIVPPLDVCLRSRFHHAQYNFAYSVDLDHLGACFGGAGKNGKQRGMAPGAGPGVVTLQQYLESNQLTKLTVNLLACGLVQDPPSESCPAFSACNNPRLILIAFPSGHSTIDLPAGRLADLPSRLHQALPQASNAYVLCLGDLFYIDTSEIRQDGSFLSRDILPTDCPFPLRPPTSAVAAAAWFMQEYTGPDFAALHLRRGDFYLRFRGYRGAKADYFPMETIAEYVAETIAAVNAATAAAAAGAAFQIGATESVIGGKGSCLRESSDWQPIRMLVLCSDAGEKQGNVLSCLLAVHGITVVRLDVVNYPAFAFSKVTIPAPARADTIVMAEKMVAANARIMFYSRCSSFSLQIKHITETQGLVSCWDSVVCEGRSKDVSLSAAGLYN
ncbi:unnamed protein product [Closterium sp. NIES-53]